jgi:Mg2+-importing ATPase
LFRTAWFLESIATQILVIFVIRTHGPAWISRPHPLLIATSLVALAGAMILVISPIAAILGFVPVSSGLAGTIAVVALAYLACAEIAKHVADRKPQDGCNLTSIGALRAWPEDRREGER